MMKIRFLVPQGGYDMIIRAHVEPILRHLQDGEIAYEPAPSVLNVSLNRESFPKADVFMSHGLADKLWRDANLLKGYSYVFVSGPAWKEKLLAQGMPENRIRIVGYPFLDPVWNLERSPRFLVWAPTHQAIPEVSSYGRFSAALLDHLRKSFPIVENPHPIKSIRFFRDILPQAKVVIADAGSSLYEAWAFGIPVVFPDWLVRSAVLERWPGSFEAKIYKEAIGWHAASERELIKLVEKAWETGELGPGVEEFIEGIFPKELRGNSGKITALKLMELREKKEGGGR